MMDMTLKMLLEHYESPGERLTPDGHPVVWVNADDLADMIALARAQESQLAAANEAKEQAGRERDEAYQGIRTLFHAVCPDYATDGRVAQMVESVLGRVRLDRDQLAAENAKLRESGGILSTLHACLDISRQLIIAQDSPLADSIRKAADVFKARPEQKGGEA